MTFQNVKTLYKFTILLMSAISTLSCTITDTPYITFSLESTESNRKIEISNAITVDISHDIIPERYILRVNPGENLKLKISGDPGTIIKKMNLYYLDTDLEVGKLPLLKALTAPLKNGLYPVILTGTISGTMGGKQNIKLTLYISVINE